MNPIIVIPTNSYINVEEYIQEPEKAIYYYKEALKINPNFKIARNNLAIAFTDLGTNLKKQGEYRESIKCYKQVSILF